MVSEACCKCPLDRDMCMYCLHNGYDPKAELIASELKGARNAKSAISGLVAMLRQNNWQDDKTWNTIKDVQEAVDGFSYEDTFGKAHD